jgi:activator of 2-hydroxyglutaryl-CoA dehydratase
LTDLYNKLPDEFLSVSLLLQATGEALIKAALHIDIGEIETMAHLKAARFFCLMWILY